MTSNPDLAQRVASRFIQAAQGSPRDLMLHKAEAAMRRSTEFLRMVQQVHGFWVAAINEGKSFGAVEHAYHKIQTLLKTYEHESSHVMGHLEAAEDIESHLNLDVIDYPDSYER